MGTDRCTRTTLVSRCCHGAFFGFGFVSTILTLTVMFWIAWCYFGLTILQISDTQRRALVNYSHINGKPVPTPTTTLLSRSTTATTEETSINSISKSPTTASILRGSSRGESQLKVDKKRMAEVITNLAKGDFADRVRETPKNATKNATAPLSKDASIMSSERETSKQKDDPHAVRGATAAILSGSEVEESDDHVYARRVLHSGSENRAEVKDESNDRVIRRNPSDLDSASRIDISPTKVYATDMASETLKVESPVERPSREEVRTQSRVYIDQEKPNPSRRDDFETSRRPDSETGYREPDFDREIPKRPAASSDRERYDELDDERRSRGRYDKKERGRESDDRYSKGDTRVYPDDKVLDRKSPSDEDRYRVRERQPDDIPRRGDDDDRYEDRYRDSDSKSRNRGTGETRYTERDLERPLPRNDRYKDDEKYRYRDDDRITDRDDGKYRTRDDDDRYRLRDDKPEGDRYRSRVEDRFRGRDEDRYRDRDDDRYRTRNDERYKLRDDDRSRTRDDDRYRYRDDERSRDDGKYSIIGDDKYRTRDDDRYSSDDRRSVPSRSTDEEDRYRPRSDIDDALNSRVKETNIREPISKSDSLAPIGDRKPTSSRTQYDVRSEESIDYETPVRDRSRLPAREEVNPSKLSRPTYEEERYRERDRDDRYGPSRYEEDEIKNISPTRTRVESSISRSTLVGTKLKRTDDTFRDSDSTRDRIRDDRIYEENQRNPGTKLQDSRRVESTRESSRRYIDETDRYRTRLHDEKQENSKVTDRREEVVLDRRSYTSEEDEDKRKGISRTRDFYEDRSRSPNDDSRRRYRDDESYSRRDAVDEEFKRDRPRDDVSRRRTNNRDRYDEDYRRYDDRYTSRDEERYPVREDRISAPARKYTNPDDDDEDRIRRRDSAIRATRTDDIQSRDEIIRPSASSRDEERFYSRDNLPESKSSSRRRYKDDLPHTDEYDTEDLDSESRRDSRGSRRSAISRDTVLVPSMSSVSSREPTDVVIREKRFQTGEHNYQSSRVTSNERTYMEPESGSKEKVRPLSAKDVIEAAIRHTDNSDENTRKVHYPVFDPRVSNLTSPDIIRPSERRGTTITARKRRSA